MVKLAREELLLDRPEMKRGRHHPTRQAETNSIRDGPILRDREDSTGLVSVRCDFTFSFK